MQATYRQKDVRVQYEGGVGYKEKTQSHFLGTSRAMAKLSVSVDCDELPPKISEEKTYPKYLPERKTFNGVFFRPIVVDVIGLASRLRRKPCFQHARICETTVYRDNWKLLSIVVRSLFYWTARGHTTIAILPHKFEGVPGVRDEQLPELIAGLRKLQDANLLLVFKVEHRMEWIRNYVDSEHAVLLTETRSWLKAQKLHENRKLPKRIFTPFLQAEGTAVFFPETNPADSHYGTPLSMAVVVTVDRMKYVSSVCRNSDSSGIKIKEVTKEQFDKFMERQLTLSSQILRLEFLYCMLPPDARFAEDAVLTKIRGCAASGGAS